MNDKSISKFLFIAQFSLIILLFFAGCKPVNNNRVKDIDGNSYKTVKIGNQIWMAENLRVTRYRNGDSINKITDNRKWITTTQGAYCYYNNNDSIAPIYGGLYNWHSLQNKKGLAPKGWHIPSEAELQILMDALGGDNFSADKMKETGTENWLYPNKDANNKSDFRALPGGYRNGQDGNFYNMRSNGYWWTQNISYQMYSWSERIFYRYASAYRNDQSIKSGLSIRCIKDK